VAGEPAEVVAEEEAEAAPVPAPVVVPDLLDLLDLSDSPRKEDLGEALYTAKPALGGLEALSMPAVAVAAASANPFAGPGFADVSAPVGPATPILPTGDVSQWLRRLCVAASGVLYEDANLQIGVKMSEAGASCQLGLYLGNKASEALLNLVIAVPPSPALALSLNDVPTVLDAKRQMLIQLEATCLAPFRQPPQLQLGYRLASTGQSLAITLELPLGVSKFCQPVEVPSEVFRSRWAQVSGAPFKLSTGVAAPPGAASREAVVSLLESLHLKVLGDDAEPRPDAIAAACLFHCGAPQAKQVPCMVLVEGLAADGAGAALTLTVATADAMLSDGLRGHIVRMLAG
jgi:hypothetical protein